MNRLRSTFGALAITAIAGVASAQTATQTVNYEVQAINKISVAGSPSLTITTAVAGSAPTAVTAGATYSITTNEADRRITAELDEAMESGLTLTATFAAPAGGSSTGAVTLEAGTAHDVVTGISTLNASGLAITYGLSATSAAGVVPATSKVVTYTIAAGV
jgi:hypothetical protein